jgi:methionine-rich copper-binding protein CopC
MVCYRGIRSPFQRLGGLIVVAALITVQGQALAHAHLEMSSPAVNSKQETVHDLMLRFSEAVEAKLCTVRVQDREDRTVVEPGAEAVADHPDTLVVHLYEALPPGQYTVVWDVVAKDGHRMKGHYQFLVSR